MIHELFEQYGIQPSELSPLGSYQTFWIRNKIYVLVPVGQFQEEELVEMKHLSDFMLEQGDTNVAAFVPTLQGYYVSTIQEKNYCLLRGTRQADRQIDEGSELALFHSRGRMYPSEISELRRIGEWRELWEKRLDQLERFWQSKVASHPSNQFEKLFIESFPYYLGMAENAIQYVVDTEIDDEPQLADAGTICYQRFTPLTLTHTKRLKIPTEWIYDHPSRDMAEWIRHVYFEQGDDASESILAFLQNYEKINPLSAFGWRLLYARLLFPLHYFETVERYYLSGSDALREAYQDRLESFLDRYQQHRRFLGSFYDAIGLPAQRLGIREVDWLK
ncbi:spore coat putative kinase YutH [Ectobacillus ponti]|uniref:Spore coat protein YutH n=1 Tax=Ectobacillus ponti TaxID=2961894 RepID=A0AA41XB88_9BACI|nr:spore coat protein YutH [Ectobacillus ponti]MCP8969780.1 spore coat protein YutH [Ectobacillus ponti]